jgi:predicted transcriptional regulator
MRPKKRNDFLTEVELELMTVLWELGKGNVRDVMGRLPAGRTLAYTSAATILRIMEQKEFVTSERDGKTFVYVPAISKDSYQSASLRDLSDKLFDGAPQMLVARLVNDAGLTPAALQDIRELLERRLSDADDPSDS